MQLPESREERLRLVRQFMPWSEDDLECFSMDTLGLLVRDIEAHHGLPWRQLLGYPVQPVLSNAPQAGDKEAKR